MELSAHKKSQLIWRCRRGMLELDLLFIRFVPHLEQLTADQLTVFSHLLECSDPDLFVWLMGYTEAPVEFQEIVKLIQSYHSA